MTRRSAGKEISARGQAEESEGGPLNQLFDEVRVMRGLLMRVLNRDKELNTLEQEHSYLQIENKKLNDENARLAVRVERLSVELKDRVLTADAARTDVGTELDAEHGELAHKAHDQLLRGLAAPATLPVPDGGIDDRHRWDALITAGMFRKLIVGLEVDGIVTERWEALRRRHPEMAREIKDDADKLRLLIADASGTQRWVYDFSPPGARFDPALFDSVPGQSTGIVDFTIAPAYFVNTILIRKPSVYLAAG